MSDPHDAFAEAEREDARDRRIRASIQRLLTIAVVIAMLMFGYVALVRGQSIQRGEEQRRALTAELAALRHDLDERDRTDQCVSDIGGALQVAIAQVLALLLDPTRSQGQPIDRAQLDAALAELDQTQAQRAAAEANCDPIPED